MGNEMTAPSEASLRKTEEVIKSYCGPRLIVYPGETAILEDLMLGMKYEFARALDEAVAQAHEEGFWMSWESGHTGHTIGRVLQNEAGKAKHCNDCGELHVYPASAIRSAGSRA